MAEEAVVAHRLAVRARHRRRRRVGAQKPETRVAARAIDQGQALELDVVDGEGRGGRARPVAATTAAGGEHRDREKQSAGAQDGGEDSVHGAGARQRRVVLVLTVEGR